MISIGRILYYKMSADDQKTSGSPNRSFASVKAVGSQYAPHRRRFAHDRH